jgi:hypothetical protein
MGISPSSKQIDTGGDASLSEFANLDQVHKQLVKDVDENKSDFLKTGIMRRN